MQPESSGAIITFQVHCSAETHSGRVPAQKNKNPSLNNRDSPYFRDLSNSSKTAGVHSFTPADVRSAETTQSGFELWPPDCVQ